MLYWVYNYYSYLLYLCALFAASKVLTMALASRKDKTIALASRKDKGELSSGDIVIIKGLASEKGKQLNGKEGVICTSDEVERQFKEGNFDVDPGLALNKNGRYNVQVEMTERNETKETRPNCYNLNIDRKMFQLKRENLELIKGSIQSTLSSSEMRSCGMRTCAEIEEIDPGLKGLFPAVGNGDHVRLREIMEHIQKKYNMRDAANFKALRDKDGNGPLIGAIQGGHLKCVEILLEFGADTNTPTYQLNPALSLQLNDVSLLHMAIIHLLRSQCQSKEKNSGKLFKDQERIVELLLEHGADPNKNSKIQGTPINGFFHIEKHSKFHDSRLKVLKMLLDHGADPNILSPLGEQMEMLPIVDVVGMRDVGSFRINVPHGI